MDYQRLLLDHLDLIDRIARTTARRRHLSGVEEEDFLSHVRLKLVENNYAILRKFQKRSSLWTYFASVIGHLSLDFCIQQWGRWRPSAKAEKLGAIAVALEKLVTRDGHTFDEAAEIIRMREVSLSHRELLALWEQLPHRGTTTQVGEEAASAVASLDSSESGIDETQQQRAIDLLERALQTAFEGIAKQDRVIIALRFDEDLPVAQIARVTNTSVPTVHRRLDASLKHLRKSLLAAGFQPREVANLIGHPKLALSPLLRAELENFSGPVRLSKRDG